MVTLAFAVSIVVDLVVIGLVSRVDLDQARRFDKPIVAAFAAAVLNVFTPVVVETVWLPFFEATAMGMVALGVVLVCGRGMAIRRGTSAQR